MKHGDTILRVLLVGLLCAMFYVAGEHNGRRDAFKDVLAMLRQAFAEDSLGASR